MLRSVSLKDSDLTDGLRILILQEGRFWPARLNSTQLPDVYGIVVEKQRGNRPLILPRDDILKEAVSFLLTLLIFIRHLDLNRFL
jgi:hypothetical protein